MRRRYGLVALLCCGCGPTEMESGQAVLLAAPFITLVGALLAAGFAKLWRPLIDGLSFRWRTTTIALCVQSLLCLGIMFFPPGSGEWVGFAMVFVGASYLTVQLVAMRIALSEKLRRHYSVISLAPWILFYPPALVLAYVGSPSTELQAFPGLLWTLPGYGGLVLAPVFVILLIEILVRRKKHADQVQREILPRPLPEARARIRK